MAQAVYQGLSFDELGRHFEEIFASGYSVSVFTDWQNHRAEQLWVKRRLKEGDMPTQWEPEFYGAKLATEKLHPLAGHPTESVTDQLGIPGPWYDRLPHFRIGQTPSSGQELQTEYLVPWESGWDAVLAVEKLREKIGPHIFVTELRTIAADRLWMSMAYQRRFAGDPLHVEAGVADAVRQVLPLIEAATQAVPSAAALGQAVHAAGRAIGAVLHAVAGIPRLAARYDPQGKFRNAFVRANLY